MAGKSLESLSNTLEQARATLVNQYVSQAHRMWDMLTPADWWNDGMTFAVASRMALLEMALIQQVRRLGVSYANETLKLVASLRRGMCLVWCFLVTIPIRGLWRNVRLTRIGVLR